MSRRTATIPADYFEKKYRSDIDPWQFRTSDYEREKYQATIAALGRTGYANALELGCSIGVLTALLAERCDSITAIDASPTAIAAARETRLDNVSFGVGILPKDFPTGKFDLVVLSELLYYFEEADLQRIATLCSGSLLSDGEIVLCHWLGETDYPLAGSAASDLFAEAVGVRLPVRKMLRNDIYRLERFSTA